MGRSSKFALLAIAALVVVMAVAVPAFAAGNVKQGDTQMITPSNMVTNLQSKHITINALGGIDFQARWNKALSWWFDVPMAMKSGSNYTNYDAATGKGVFYHTGQLVWVDSAGTTHLGWKWQGLRVVALSKTSYQLVVTAGNTKPYIANDVVASYTGAAKITKSGKKYHIDGIKFKLTPTGAQQIATALQETVPSTTLITFDSDIYFTMK